MANALPNLMDRLINPSNKANGFIDCYNQSTFDKSSPSLLHLQIAFSFLLKKPPCHQSILLSSYAIFFSIPGPRYMHTAFPHQDLKILTYSPSRAVSRRRSLAQDRRQDYPSQPSQTPTRTTRTTEYMHSTTANEAISHLPSPILLFQYHVSLSNIITLSPSLLLLQDHCRFLPTADPLPKPHTDNIAASSLPYAISPSLLANTLYYSPFPIQQQ